MIPLPTEEMDKSSLLHAFLGKPGRAKMFAVVLLASMWFVFSTYAIRHSAAGPQMPQSSPLLLPPHEEERLLQQGFALRRKEAAMNLVRRNASDTDLEILDTEDPDIVDPDAVFCLSARPESAVTATVLQTISANTPKTQRCTWKVATIPAIGEGQQDSNIDVCQKQGSEQRTKLLDKDLVVLKMLLPCQDRPVVVFAGAEQQLAILTVMQYGCHAIVFDADQTALVALAQSATVASLDNRLSLYHNVLSDTSFLVPATPNAEGNITELLFAVPLDALFVQPDRPHIQATGRLLRPSDVLLVHLDSSSTGLHACFGMSSLITEERPPFMSLTLKSSPGCMALPFLRFMYGKGYVFATLDQVYTLEHISTGIRNKPSQEHEGWLLQ